MALHINQIQNILIKKNNETPVVTLIIDYATLKQKLESPEDNSWYFKQGLKASKENLLSINKEYEEIRTWFNEETIDSFIEKVNENNQDVKEFKGSVMNFARQLHLSSINSQNRLLNELIRFKGKIDVLQPIDHYLEYPEEFLTLLD